ncbi:magnesium transporter MgtE N-terminal domain-containing protein [Actinoplanes siamensis]|nr:hypothetical protein [Actinoplanes siamensis]
MRAIADSTHRTLSHTAVHMALTGTRGVPTWPILHAIVQALGGDAEEFRTLWVRARDHEDGDAPSAPEPSIQPTHPLVATPRRRSPPQIAEYIDETGHDPAKMNSTTLHASRQEIVGYILNSHPRRVPEILKSLPGTLAGLVLNSLPADLVRRLALSGDRELADLLISTLNTRKSAHILGSLPPLLATDVVARVPSHDAAQMLAAVDPELAAQILADLRPDAAKAEVLRHVPPESLLIIFSRAHLRQKLQIMPALVQNPDRLSFVVIKCRPPTLRVLLDAMPMADFTELLSVEMEADSRRRLAQIVSPSRMAMTLADMPVTSAALLLSVVPMHDRQLILKQLPDRARIRLASLVRVTQRARIRHDYEDGPGSHLPEPSG